MLMLYFSRKPESFTARLINWEFGINKTSAIPISPNTISWGTFSSETSAVCVSNKSKLLSFVNNSIWAKAPKTYNTSPICKEVFGPASSWSIVFIKGFCDFDSRRISKIVTLYSPVIFNSANVFPRNVESDFTPTRNRFWAIWYS